MANLDTEMKIFHGRIVLPPGKEEFLRTARDAIRERIRKYFRESLQIQAPKFRGQGAHAMRTMINPIAGEYDIDDGVYLQHLDRRDKIKWLTPETFHLWIFNATDGHAYETPELMKSCIRVTYGGHYHVDLPIYAELDGTFHMAECGTRGWHASDPRALTDWFVTAVKTHGEQLRRVVRYLKAWADFQAHRRGKLPGGLIVTVCGVCNFVADERDDIALAKTLRAIEHDIDIIVFVLNPADMTEELTAQTTDAQKKRFQEAIKEAVVDANQAIEMEDRHQASKLWANQLGDRFPII